jgi:hypothetical protein
MVGHQSLQHPLHPEGPALHALLAVELAGPGGAAELVPELREFLDGLQEVHLDLQFSGAEQDLGAWERNGRGNGENGKEKRNLEKKAAKRGEEHQSSHFLGTILHLTSQLSLFRFIFSAVFGPFHLSLLALPPFFSIFNWLCFFKLFLLCLLPFFKQTF